jgi:hypothetical protein
MHQDVFENATDPTEIIKGLFDTVEGDEALCNKRLHTIQDLVKGGVKKAIKQRLQIDKTMEMLTNVGHEVHVFLH